MRLTFLDEAGIAKESHEPIVVIAGVIVHADKQCKRLQDRIRKVVDDYIPPQDREGFIFHATELFSGGRYFDRVTWPLCVRWAILEKLASIPREFDLPVVFGFQIRKQIPSELDGECYTDKIRTTASQLHAFSIAWSA